MRILSIWTHDPSTKQPPTPEQFQRMTSFIDELRAKGSLVDTGGALDGSLELRMMRRNGRDTIVDGPFAESKEVVGGYALFEVTDRDEAIELTRRFLDLVGDGTCELHEVTSA